MNHEIIVRYANSLFEHLITLAEDDALKMLESLKILENLINKTDDLKEFFYSPAFFVDEKKMIFAEIAEKVNLHQFVKNFFNILIENRKIPALKNVIFYTEKLYNSHLGIVEAELVTPLIFNDEEIESIKEKMKTRFHGKKINIKVKIDETLLGGALLKIGNNIYDGSIKGMIKELRATLMENV